MPMTDDVIELATRRHRPSSVRQPRQHASSAAARHRLGSARRRLARTVAAPDGSHLPPFEPGAHIDLTLPDGTMRQYSL